MPEPPASCLEPGCWEHEVAAIVALIRSKHVENKTLAALIEHVGSAVQLAVQTEEDVLFPDVEAGTDRLAGSVPADAIRTSLDDVEAWQRRGLDVRTILDPDYPTNLRTIYNRPPLLFVEGEWDEKRDSRAIAVVGTRKASSAGLQRARRLAHELVGAKFTIISGMAAGVDTAAHTAALDAQGRTVAVMGTGLDHRYPQENATLADRIVTENGALVTQFFPHQRPTRWTFGLRNVTMSGLALATAVVEASATSGAKMQARYALEHGRPVFLLASLVEEHSWAADYVEEGRYGNRAVMVASTTEIVERIDALALAEPLQAAV